MFSLKLSIRLPVRTGKTYPVQTKQNKPRTDKTSLLSTKNKQSYHKQNQLTADKNQHITNKDHKSCDFTYVNVHENCMSSVAYWCTNSILNTSKFFFS